MEMRKYLSARILFALVTLGVVVLAVACRGPAPTATPAPPTVNIPTPLPPAPTAPPLTEAPTEVPTATPPPTATAIIPTAAPTSSPTNVTTVELTTVATGASTSAPTSAPTNAPIKPPETAPTNPTASNPNTTANNPTPRRPANTAVPLVDRGPLTGLYVASLRYEPDFPVVNDPVRFYATLVNRTGKEQNYPVCAEIFRPDAVKSFGITNCDTLTIPSGTNEVFIGSWIGTGIKECIPVRARTVLREKGDETRLVFTTLNGGALWTDFKVCP